MFSSRLSLPITRMVGRRGAVGLGGKTMKYKELIHEDPDMKVLPFRWNDDNYCVVYNNQYAWVAREEDFDRVASLDAENPDNSYEWYGRFCELCPAVPFTDELIAYLESLGLKGNWIW